MAYLDIESFKNLSVIPGEFVDAIEAVAPGWVDAQLDYYSNWIDSRLRKRYAAPFAQPYPTAITGWLARLVTVRCFLKRGIDPTDQQFSEIKADAETARAEVQEAADSDVGLFELPLMENTTATGAVKGGPYAYSEQSPYAFSDVQANVGHNEDFNRSGGTFG